MSHEPVMSHLAVDAVRRHVGSARPGAPVVPERRPRRRSDAARSKAAGALRRAAEWIEPNREPRPQCA
ncbi:hypothetical protein [Myceligenerans pegani]|uniref:Uncharacterized protein n=1 Tax=Myceligenerans pegani TaxID=2776917 RepID=A0ABR9MZ24_9MICO|nr:hypothetical protein [Myceligenerans sp. TRM 65318]MBE1876646.1 hypothetical protein [Myceligenerans sp. TRM 65318]MBE3018917.1 hypothetical protein [Myceligenerans sp. TRM 65318]